MSGKNANLRFKLVRNARLLAVWDFDRAGTSLGGLLLLLAEARIRLIVEKFSGIDLCLVGNRQGKLPEAISKALSSLEDIEKIFYLNNFHELSNLLSTSEYASAWPKDITSCRAHELVCTLPLQRLYAETKIRPRLFSREEHINWANDFINNIRAELVVAVHLKNNPTNTGSNAEFSSWLGFFKEAARHFAVKFILLGNERMPPKIEELSNVILPRLDLSKDFALIQCADIFLGMTSGPCQMAILGDKPYQIYKNPGHHAEEMARELGSADCLPFAGENQKIFRVQETTDLLLANFRRLFLQGAKDLNACL